MAVHLDQVMLTLSGCHHIMTIHHIDRGDADVIALTRAPRAAGLRRCALPGDGRRHRRAHLRRAAALAAGAPTRHGRSCSVVRRGSDNKSAWMQLLWQLGIAVLQSLAAGSRALGSSALPPAPQLLAPSAGLFAAAAAARHRGAVLAELARRRVDERPDYDVCRGACGARARCRFRNRGTNSLSESGVEWMNGRTKFECDRTLGECGRVVRRVPAVAPAASAAVRCGQCASQSCFGALCGVLGEIDSTHRELHWKSQYFLQAECCRKLPTHCRSSRPLCGPSAHRGLNHRACPDFFRLPGCSARWFEAHAPAGCADVAAFAQQLLVSGGEGAAEVDKGALVIVGVLCKATSILTDGSPRSSLGGGTSMGSGWCRLRAPLSYMYMCHS